MGSVIDHMDCPRCKSEYCTIDFYYKSGEEYVFCPDCGYNYQHHIERDEEGKVVKTGINGYKWTSNESEPYAALHLKYKKGFGSMGHINTEEDYNQMKEDVDKFIEANPDVVLIETSRFDGKEIIKDIWYKKEKEEVSNE